jgi:threonine/homoserine/homoserine lactone efflux protein
MSVEFLLISTIVAASPGPGVLVTLAAGLSDGRRAALVAAFGCTLGIVPHMLAAVTGLAALLHANAPAFEAVKYAGAAYLIYMAWATLRQDGGLRIDARQEAPPNDRAAIRSAVFVNLLNPKLSVFFFAFLPQFVASDAADQTFRMLELSAAFMAVTFAVFAVYGLFAASVRARIRARPGVLAWVRGIFAAAFFGLGVKLFLAER